MKNIIKAKDREHLEFLIQEEINLYGFNVDLNHIDISDIDDLSALFKRSQFNGNISEWNT